MYKNVKDIFLDKHKQSDIVEDCVNFLKKMEEYKSYIVEFFEDDAMKPKIYLFNYTISDKNCQAIIVITHNKYIFFGNNKFQKTKT